MAAKTKAVGVRFPLELIERIEQYQIEQGVNLTEALVKLVERGLGCGEVDTVKTLDIKLDERITAQIERLLDTKLDERITKLVNNKLNVALDNRYTVNIPSDDSSHSESIFQDVQIIQTEVIEQVSGEIPESLSFGDFHKMLDLSNTGKPNKAKGDIAIAIAKARGHGDWIMNSTTRRFTKLADK